MESFEVFWGTVETTARYISVNNRKSSYLHRDAIFLASSCDITQLHGLLANQTQVNTA